MHNNCQTLKRVHFQLFINICRNFSKMTKSKNRSKQNSESKNVINSPIVLDQSKCISIKVHAKPGAKKNAVTDISPEGIGIQINAPPTEGEANTELIRYLVEVLGLPKKSVSLDKGFKSRQKVVKVTTDSLTVEDIEGRIRKEMEDSK